MARTLTPIRKLLVANRGEIALRIIRAAKEMEIPVVAVYSEADRESIHVQAADESVCIGPAPPKESYLHIPNIISAALTAGCDAVHPGYGFLAEIPSFARACEQCGLTLVGPSADSMEKAGDKARAREIMRKAGIPTIPGTKKIVTSDREAETTAHKVGYPVMIKAAAGGGGKGMRIVRKPQDMAAALQTARAEAESAFGKPEVYLEKLLERPRHIEFQIVADRNNTVVHLGERDCSLQTARHQKLLEESPSLAISSKLRARIGEAAVKAARAVGYTNAGTVEFLVDQKKRFYFMEMNTRIQVEHPVTEEVTGIDLVKQQLMIASGRKLGYAQKDISLRGHAIECRITAEDPEREFAPSGGKIADLHLPAGFGIRVDTHIYCGYTVPNYYDSLLAKLIAWGRDRAEAISRMRRALDEFRISGLPTTLDYHRSVIRDEEFLAAQVCTDFVEKRMKRVA
jgi:acetyl-CoA carboxylase biotin carboxylase subunit